MLRLVRCIAIATTLVAGVGGAAHAHRPYLAGEHLALYMGCCELAELRLLYGDRVIGSDPVRPVVVGAQGRVYALGPKGDAASIACFRAKCHVFVFRGNDLLPQALVPDRSGFRFETEYRVAADDVNSSTATERAPEIFGFVAEPLDPVLLIAAAWALIAQSPLTAVLLVAISLGVWPTCRLAFAAFRARTPGRRAGLAAAAAACGLATFALWAFAWGALAFVTGFPVPMAIPITVLAALLVLSRIAFAWRRRRREAAA